MDALVLLRGARLRAEDFQRPAYVKRGLLLPGDERIFRTSALSDGSLAVDLICPFEALRQRPEWGRLPILRHVVGDAIGAHDDSRGLFVFEGGGPLGATYDETIALHPEGLWVSRAPSFPNQVAADLDRFRQDYARMDEAARRQLLRLPPKGNK